MSKTLSVSCALMILGVSQAGCAPVDRRSQDYIFGVTGIVTAEDGTPLQDAEVNLSVSGPVYRATELVGTQRRVTNKTGGFVFMYNSHERGVQYTIAVRKEGFEPMSVTGAAPPAGHHTIRLKKAAEGRTP